VICKKEEEKILIKKHSETGANRRLEKSSQGEGKRKAFDKRDIGEEGGLQRTSSCDRGKNAENGQGS